MNKKRLAIVSILIVLAVVLFLVIFMLVNNNKTKNNNSEVNKPIENKPIQSEIVELDINSKLVSDLYKYILKNNIVSEETVYQNKKVNSNHLNDVIKTLTVFNNIDVEKECYKTEYDDAFSHDEYSEYYFSKKFIDDKAKMIFGNDVSIVPQNEINLMGAKINFKNGEYVFTKYPGGGVVPYYSNSKLVKAEKKDDKLYIYDKYIHVVESTGSKCYNASDRMKVLMEKDEVYLNLKVDDVANVDTFKHTFEKDDAGLYHWVSTEIVK